MRAFLIALQFLTRLPVRLRSPPSESELGRSLLFYPLVGLLIGGLLALLATALSLGHIHDLLAAALVLAAWTLVTGGLHLDGLADSADAWIGGHGERERTLSIMKDPRCGPMAVTTLVVILLLKFAALAALSADGASWSILLAALLSRTALPLLFLTTPYVRPGGLGSALSAHLPRKTAAATVALTCIAVLAGFDWAGGLAIATALAMYLLLRRTMLATIGGTTGDTAGALVEMVETGVLVVMASAGRIWA